MKWYHLTDMQKFFRFHDFYISSELDFVLPDGEPVIYRCNAKGSGACYTDYVKNGIRYGLEYLKNGGPTREWRNSFYAAQQYVDRLSIDDIILDKK